MTISNINCQGAWIPIVKPFQRMLKYCKQITNSLTNFQKVNKNSKKIKNKFLQFVERSESTECYSIDSIDKLIVLVTE